MKKIHSIILCVIIPIIVLIGGSVIVVQECQNKAISIEESVETSISDLNIQEKRRIDLIFNLVDCVKSYNEYEANTIKSIIQERGSNGDIENVTTAITAVSEAYPQLKSNENYQKLMKELSVTENLIAEYRSNYNNSVKTYNRYIRKFPTRFFLSWSGYEVLKYDYLKYDSPETAPQNIFE